MPPFPGHSFLGGVGRIAAAREPLHAVNRLSIECNQSDADVHHTHTHTVHPPKHYGLDRIFLPVRQRGADVEHVKVCITSTCMCGQVFILRDCIAS